MTTPHVESIGLAAYKTDETNNIIPLETADIRFLAVAAKKKREAEMFRANAIGYYGPITVTGLAEQIDGAVPQDEIDQQVLEYTPAA